MRHSLRVTRPLVLGVAALLLSVGSVAAVDTALAGRVRAHGQNEHVVAVGLSDDMLIVRGDGSTDLDCWVYDSRGRLADSDTDDTDYCVLSTPGVGRHRLVIKNLGGVYNDYSISQE